MVLFVCLNPSIADDNQDDPTQVRMRGFAQKWGFGGYYVGNLFAFISTDPLKLKQVKDPIGISNDTKLLELSGLTTMTVVAWGCGDNLTHRRAAKVIYDLRKIRDIYAIDICKDGCPRHPLYLKQTSTPFKFRSYLSPEG